MTPQEQPDSQAGDELSIEQLINDVVIKYAEAHGLNIVAAAKDLYPTFTKPMLDLIEAYAERLATERVHQFANLLKEGSKQTGTVSIDEGLKVFEATLTKEAYNA